MPVPSSYSSRFRFNGGQTLSGSDPVTVTRWTDELAPTFYLRPDAFNLEAAPAFYPSLGEFLMGSFPRSALSSVLANPPWVSWGFPITLCAAFRIVAHTVGERVFGGNNLAVLMGLNPGEIEISWGTGLGPTGNYASGGAATSLVLTATSSSAGAIYLEDMATPLASTTGASDLGLPGSPYIGFSPGASSLSGQVYWGEIVAYRRALSQAEREAFQSYARTEAVYSSGLSGRIGQFDPELRLAAWF
jgi:hypothetical protein